MNDGQSSGSSSAEVRTGLVPDAAAGLRIDAGLALAAPDLSRERIKTLILEGAVMLDGKPVTRPSGKLAAGMAYVIRLPAAQPLDAEAQAIALDIVYEDEHLLVVDKPAGLVVHPAAGHADGTLVNALLHHCAGQLSGIGGVARPGIVHRIDKDTSGLLVVAKTDAAHLGLAAQFAEHSINRRYVAIVQGRPSPANGTVRGNIGRSDHDRKKMALVGEGRGKHAVTHFTTEERLRDAARIECRLETGRTHQVRVHMASIGHALLGDPLYSRPPKGLRDLLKAADFRRQALHAQRLGFIHPVTGSECDFFSPIPADMAELLDRLRV
ncbi:ribosomal large subunit pseudouridine synthase D [Blastomonas natatoria]|uniref:Pseudouridine synthase n=1 Tax=Blastomonas natatoria TaxID=34015 RepID=A0A2V3V9N6_9SPHN|nr:RluA family pseudouridine synthase [Blastomonas natatoria]PXW77581.1 ribosomal large subunit pseudouridine synthase D [Blastomonas natatoria]